MISRRRTREFLLQSLYSRHELREAFVRENFIESYFDDENVAAIDMAYVDVMETAILTHEKELISMVSVLIPKFDLPTIPVMHIMILMIALTEMLYTPSLETPEAVSMNEAIELAKRFSDDQGRMLINWALSHFLKEKEKVTQEEKGVLFRIFDNAPKS